MKEITPEEMERVAGGCNWTYDVCRAGWVALGVSVGGVLGGVAGYFAGKSLCVC